MAPFVVSKSNVPKALHSVYDSIAKKGGNKTVVDGNEVQEFGAVLQDALSKGTITEQSVKRMGYSCNQIKPKKSLGDTDNSCTWAAEYSSKGQEVAEEATMSAIKYTSPLLHYVACRNVNVEKGVKFIPSMIGSFCGIAYGMIKDFKDDICGPGYTVE